MADDKNTTDNNDDLFKGIDPESLAPELKTLYKSMQSDYVRKTQSVAEERKRLDSEKQSYETKLVDYGKVSKELEDWRNWYAGLQATADADAALDTTKLPQTPSSDDPTDPGVTKLVGDLRSQVTDLESKLQSVNAAIRNSTDQTNRMFNYHAQLAELKTKHPLMDKAKLLDHALKEGITDLEKAYNDMYRDDIIEELAQKRAQEIRANDRLTGISGPGKQIIVRSGVGGAKSFDEATEQILKELSAAGKL